MKIVRIKDVKVKKYQLQGAQKKFLKENNLLIVLNKKI